jgi:putative endonuclease
VYFVYIIKSKADGSFYTGQCQDIQGRLQHHNSGYTKSTKAKIPWQIVYYEKYDTRSEAVRRELEVKKKKSRQYIEKLISKSSEVLMGL